MAGAVRLTMDTVAQTIQDGKETRDTFVMVPRSVLNDRQLTPYDLTVYLRIANVKPDSGGYRTISLDGIANAAQMARSTVQKGIKRLVTFKHVAIDGEKETNRYFLTTPLYGKVPSSLTSRESSKRRFVPPMGTARRYDNHTARRYHIRIESNNKSNKLLNSKLSSIQVTSKELSNSTSITNSNLLPSENLAEAKVQPREVPVVGKSFHTTNFVTQRRLNDSGDLPKEPPKRKPDLLPWQKQIFDVAAPLAGKSLKSLLPTEGLRKACKGLALACSKASDSEASVLSLSQRFVNIVINGVVRNATWEVVTFGQFLGICAKLKRAEQPLDLESIDQAIQSLCQPVGRS